MTALTAGLVDRWFDRVVTPSAEPGSQWPLAVDLWLTPSEAAVVREGHRQLRRALNEPVRPEDHGADRPDWRQDPVCRPVGAFLEVLSAAVGDALRTLETVAGSDGDGPATGGPVRADALAVAAGINAGAAALAGSANGPRVVPTAAEAARRAGEAAAEAAVGGADLPAVAARAAAAMVSGWDAAPPDPTDSPDAPVRVRALVGRLLVGLQLATRPPDPPARPAPCGAGPGDVLGRMFTAEITCEIAVAVTQVATVRGELQELATLVRFWPRSSGGPGGAAEASSETWQRVHVHTDRPGAVVEVLFASGSVFDLQITTLD